MAFTDNLLCVRTGLAGSSLFTPQVPFSVLFYTVLCTTEADLLGILSLVFFSF